MGIGNLKLFETVEDPSVPAEIVDQVEALEVGGKTIMVVHDRDRFPGITGLADQPRNEALAMLDRPVTWASGSWLC